MIINRHNYEEFFLLYVDKELGAEEQRAVEAFVGQNSDLANELEVLKQITLADENIEFTQKELLYKNESGISLADYEEYFLLFADKELSEKEASEVERFVLKHPQLQDEFTLLQKVRLQPEPVVFAGKQKLYRKEENQRRVILFRLAKMSAAAAIAGALYLSFLFYNNSKRSDAVSLQISNPQRKEALGKNDSSLLQQRVAQKTGTPLPFKTEKNPIEKVVAKNIKPEKSIPKKFKIIKEQGETIADIKVNESQKETPIEEKNLASLEKTPSQQQRIEEEKPVAEFHDNSNFNISDHESKEDVFLDNPLAKEDKLLATHAVYLETDDVEQEKTLYIGSARINKNKVKGLFKKAADFLDKQLRGGDN